MVRYQLRLSSCDHRNPNPKPNLEILMIGWGRLINQDYPTSSKRGYISHAASDIMTTSLICGSYHDGRGNRAENKRLPKELMGLPKSLGSVALYGTTNAIQFPLNSLKEEFVVICTREALLYRDSNNAKVSGQEFVIRTGKNGAHSGNYILRKRGLGRRLYSVTWLEGQQA